MDSNIHNQILRFREVLNARDDAPVVGEMPLGNSEATCAISSWRDFLAACNGGRFGAIDIWSFEELPAEQDVLLTIENPDDYLIIGQILYEPLTIEKATENVYWMPRHSTSKSLGTIDSFLSHYIFGTGYEVIIPDADQEPWWALIKSVRGI